MKYFSLVLIIGSLGIADNDGNFGSSVASGVQNPGSDAISLTLVNDWVLSGKALGLDVFFTVSDGYILGADNNLDIIQAYDFAGTPQGPSA